MPAKAVSAEEFTLTCSSVNFCVHELDRRMYRTDGRTNEMSQRNVFMENFKNQNKTMPIKKRVTNSC